MTRNARLLLFLGAGGVLAGGLVPEARLLFFSALLLAWVALEGAAFFWTAHVRFPRKVRVFRETPALGPGGTAWLRTPARARLILENRSRLPIGPVEAEDLWPDAIAGGPGRTPRLAGWIPARGRLEIESEMSPSRIGVFRIPGILVRIHSMRGLFAREFLLDRPLAIRVLPPIGIEGKWLNFTKRRNRMVRIGLHPYRRAGSGTEFLELRDYVPGDPWRRIAWKISAKRGRLMTRDVESEVPMNATILVDGSATMFRKDAGATRRDLAAECAARIVQAAFQNRDGVGLRIVGTGRDAWIPPGRGRGHLVRILWTLSERLPLAPVRDAPLSRASRRDFLAWIAWRHPRLLGGILRKIPWAARQRFLAPSSVRLAIAAAAALDLPPSAVDECLADRAQLGRRVEEWARLERLPGLDAVVGPDEPLESEGRAKLRALAAAIRTDLHRARDDEVAVIVSDLEGPEDAREEFLAAARTFLARHHPIVVAAPPSEAARRLAGFGALVAPLDPENALVLLARQFSALRRGRRGAVGSASFSPAEIRP